MEQEGMARQSAVARVSHGGGGRSSCSWAHLQRSSTVLGKGW